MEKNKKNQKKALGKPKYLNKNCWLVKSLNYAPYKRCQYCELKFRNCMFLHYQVISLISIFLLLVFSFLIDGKVSELVIVFVFALVIIYGLFFNKSTDKIIQANFTERKTKESLEELSQNLESRVSEQTKEIREKTNNLEDLLKKNQALSQMKTEFLRVVNHQLRTPTSIIKGMLSMLVEGSIDGEKKKQEAIDKVYSSADRLETILDDILDAQDLVDGKPSPNLKPTSLEELINKVISPMLILAKQKKIKLEFKKPIKQLPKILLDAVLIEKALKKIIDNAVLYTEKGNVIINAEIIKNQQIQKELVKITIKDSGVGITDADKSKLFRIFTRGVEAERIHQNGSGLGLYIANEYIKANQGKIEVESEGKNKGTTFTIILPVITEV
ncbi:MAG: HAMP domain-containing sensor histidine kinase [bacterium]